MTSRNGGKRDRQNQFFRATAMSPIGTFESIRQSSNQYKNALNNQLCVLCELCGENALDFFCPIVPYSFIIPPYCREN
jgi:hypothetical protein